MVIFYELFYREDTEENTQHEEIKFTVQLRR